jgi:hypothetical protein
MAGISLHAVTPLQECMGARATSGFGRLSCGLVTRGRGGAALAAGREHRGRFESGGGRGWLPHHKV